MVSLAGCMPDVAVRLLGQPTSRSKAELRFGKHGSLSIDLAAGTWFSHEENAGGGVLDLVVRERGGSRREAAEWLRDECGVELDDDFPPATASTPRDRHPAANGADPGHHQAASSLRVVSSYVYRDAEGRPRYRVVRLEPKTFRQERYDAATDSFVGGKGCMSGVDLLPYRLDEWSAEIGAPVLIVEGEKDVDRLIGMGHLATCNPGGTGKWIAEWAPMFEGRDVVILPDNDPFVENDPKKQGQGRRHAADVARSLRPVAASLRLLELRDLPDKGDVSDWLDQGHTPAEFERELSGAKPITDQILARLFEGRVATLSPFRLIDPAKLFLDPPRREYIVQDWVPVGHVTSLYGAPGSGKSFLAQYLLTSVATNRTWLDLETVQVPVFGLFAEDDEDELHRRQVVINRYLGLRPQDLSNGFSISAMEDDLLFLMSAHGDTEPRLTETYDRLVETVQLVEGRLILLDNIAQLYDANESDRAVVTRFLNYLKQIARRRRGAVVLLGHPSRGKDQGDAYSGSSAWEANVRSRIEFERLKPKDPTDQAEERRYKLILAKSNSVQPKTVDIVLDRQTGVVRPDHPEFQTETQRMEEAAKKRKIEEHILNAVQDLWRVSGIHVSDAPQARSGYLPKCLDDKGMTGGYSQTQLTEGMNRLLASGRLRRGEVGRHVNGKPRSGLVVAEEERS